MKALATMDMIEQPHNDTTILHLSGPFHFSFGNIEQVMSMIDQVTKGAVRSLIVNLERVPFLEPGVVGLFLSLQKDLAQKGIRMVLAQPQEMVRIILENIGVSAKVPIYLTLGQALPKKTHAPRRRNPFRSSIEAYKF
jgi:anti-anti-sigma factor